MIVSYRNISLKKITILWQGDKVMNSKDSRYWGLLPEKFIVGKATLIWKSVDLNTDEIRWNRVFKRIE